jgi:hypothetical protein
VHNTNLLTVRFDRSGRRTPTVQVPPQDLEVIGIPSGR